MPGIPSKDASFVWGTPRNYALTSGLFSSSKKTIFTFIDNLNLILHFSYLHWVLG